ncbi:helix-turn-helix transcriptional regulator [Streptomyces sp. NPDC006140]|uniref:helix-turn-helix domain-containing protein n=1 Tax=Streptomyces sp. NPDC006140 TaxID=3154579 RepID=UPI003409E8A4
MHVAIARTLVHLRAKRGWSVYDLEERTGVSRSTLSRIERAVTTPKLAVLVRVCLAYGCSVAHLLTEAEAEVRGTAAGGSDTSG